MTSHIQHANDRNNYIEQEKYALKNRCNAFAVNMIAEFDECMKAKMNKYPMYTTFNVDWCIINKLPIECIDFYNKERSMINTISKNFIQNGWKVKYNYNDNVSSTVMRSYNLSSESYF